MVGLQDQIKGMCDRFALAGFDALAPDLYKGTVVPYHDTDAAGKEMNSLDFMDATTQTVRGAVQYLARAAQGRPDRLLPRRCGDHHRRHQDSRNWRPVWCSTAFRRSRRQACRRQIPLQGHFATKDDWCTPALVDGF